MCTRSCSAWLKSDSACFSDGCANGLIKPAFFPALLLLDCSCLLVTVVVFVLASLSLSPPSIIVSVSQPYFAASS